MRAAAVGNSHVIPELLRYSNTSLTDNVCKGALLDGCHGAYWSILLVVAPVCGDTASCRMACQPKTMQCGPAMKPQ